MLARPTSAFTPTRAVPISSIVQSDCKKGRSDACPSLHRIAGSLHAARDYACPSLQVGWVHKSTQRFGRYALWIDDVSTVR